MAERLRKVFQEIARRYEFEKDTMEGKEDHVHFFDTAFSVFFGPGCRDNEEHIGQGSVQGASGGQGIALGGRVIEKWLWILFIEGY